VEELVPGACDTTQAQFWPGLRPATPSNVPSIGRWKVGGLFINTGHGKLGWTHACGSGKSITHLTGLEARTPQLAAGARAPVAV
jgi:D-amino-acid dehydrogenase